MTAIIIILLLQSFMAAIIIIIIIEIFFIYHIVQDREIKRVFIVLISGELVCEPCL